MRTNLTRDPRFRADCAEFFHEQEEEQMWFRGPDAVINALEAAADKSGRTFNAQMLYVIGICLHKHHPTPDDPRSMTDWRVLMAQLEFLPEDGAPWRGSFDKWPEKSGSV